MLKHVTLKPGLEVVQGHLKWRRSIDCIRVPIVVVMILLEVNEFKKRFETVTFIITKNVFFSLLLNMIVQSAVN